MQFDYTKTLALIKGGLLDHENTWKTYLEECPDWKEYRTYKRHITGIPNVLNVAGHRHFSQHFGHFGQFAMRTFRSPEKSPTANYT